MFSRPQRGILIPLAAITLGLAGALSGSTAGAVAPTGDPAAAAPETADGATVVRNVVMAVHGGAGSLPRGSITPEQEQAFRSGLERALRAGVAAINEGRPSLDAVEAAVRVLEDDPNFNAGKGAVFNTDGEQELDASIMNGRDQRSGAVAGVHNTKNPISLARMVMERSRHVLMAGRGADIFALQNGVPYTTQDYFFTQRRWDALIAAKNPPPSAADLVGETVGAVAIDRNRDIAAATSTGGLTNKLVGRVGDSPIIGAGTYANNRTLAISCTGTGEVFIRGVAAYDISAQMEYGGRSVQRAAANVITEKIPALGATGGAIALDPNGRLATPHSTDGLINAYITRDGTIVTRIYNDETPPR
ncbi:MAG TPA: isoaspartyl peptidase/L-asparaginase [Actinophytocola sp.]|uniref:isoaspartyl peptidase/L-asparaginase family protein n=1 Tax=Actinophytocola sp. TaxID=1872138 RepID=UPI002DDD502D|nr:isoaspartyl peptidase/L-asparaginase [Actinophytocola sp.]HEV2779453.1 isoaspartyl peptidase/L-asparaginase [Actinophytocola sp.]